MVDTNRSVQVGRKFCWQVSVKIDTSLSYVGRGKLSWKKWPHHIDLWGSLWCIFFIADWCERAHLIVGASIPGLVILGILRKQGKQTIKFKPIEEFILDFCFSFWFQVLTLGSKCSWIINCKLQVNIKEKHFSPKFVIVIVFIVVVKGVVGSFPQSGSQSPG